MEGDGEEEGVEGGEVDTGIVSLGMFHTMCDLSE